MHIHITALYIAILLLIQIALTFAVIRLRFKERIALGDGNNAALQQQIRAHANFTEIVPLTLIAMMALEIIGLNHAVQHGLGAVLVISRIVHVIGMTVPGKMRLRQLGMVASIFVMASSAFILLYKALL